ncbi:MAG: ubiquitin-conjugating enzyme E2 [Candidatus Micrarchaeota archaeon]
MPTLPEAVFRRRLQAESEELKKSKYRVSASPDLQQFEISLNVKAYQKTGSNVSPRFDHKFRITINRSYPYAGGFEVVWLTPIFHPNINDRNGKVCIHLLNEWAASQTLLSLVKAIEHMLLHPNVKSPLNMEAGEYFYFHPELMGMKFEEIEKPGRPRIMGR